MRQILYMAAILGALTSCDKIIAEDITGETPVLILPTANDTVQNNPVHFKWEEITGASGYHLMVVSPGFSAISTYTLDTIVSGTDFYYALDSNAYELKLIALNAGYESQTLGPVKFWVGVQPTSVGGIVLTSPGDASYENLSFTGLFTWNPMANATYEISIRQGSNFATGTILEVQNNISSTSYTSGLTFTEGIYNWGVKAYPTAGGETPFYTRILYIDGTDPNEAIPGTPADFANENAGSIPFIWNNGTDPGSIHAPVNSLLELATDAAFGTITNSQLVQGNTVNLTLTSGIYYWRVTNYDDAGNTAPASISHQLTIN